MSEEYNDQVNTDEEESELSHTDKIIGLVTEPAAMFSRTAKFPIKTLDWLLPVLIVLIITVISSIAVMSVPDIKMEIRQKTQEQINKGLEIAAKKGATADQLARQKEMGDKQLDFIGTPAAYVVQTISILILGFIIFLIVASFYFLLFKLGFKNPITYLQTLFLYGIVQYIGTLSIIVNTLLSLVLKKAFLGVNLGLIMSPDSSSFVYLLLSKVDPFSIATYFLLGLGFARFAKAEKPWAHLIGVFGSWIGLSIIWFVLTNTVPFFMMFKG